MAGESPAMAIMNALAEIPLEQLKKYCGEHPSARSVCKWCGGEIFQTPWYSPSGTFHLCGWIHGESESSSCGKAYPYKFAEPA
jgi:hypothetical protein